MADETSLRDDIAAVVDASEKAPAPAEPVQQELAVVTPAEPIGEKPTKERDPKGRFAPKIGESEKEPTKVEVAPKVEEKAPAEAKPEEKPAEPERPKVRAPASWKPTAREGWDKLPPDIQQEVIRREREISHTLNETAEARQNYQKFRDVVSPFEAMIKAQGAEPIQAVGNLLRTAAALATAPALDRAQIVATIIKSYGVDIKALDDILSGQQPSQAPAYQPPQPQQFRDPRLDALLEQQTQTIQVKAAEALSEVEAEEFFDDVREDMADILELAGKRRVAMSARDAYNRAVALNPEVSRVLEQRKAAATSQGATQRAMAASSSVRAQPSAGPGQAQTDGSVRADLEQAWERLQGRRT